MTSLFLASIGEQLFGFNKEMVVGVGPRQAKRNPSKEVITCKYLRLPNNERADIFDLLSLFDCQCNGKTSSAQECYLILKHKERYAAILIHGRGKNISVTDPTTMTLPPAFSQHSKELVPEIILNGNDIILLTDVDVLFQHFSMEDSTEALPA